MHRALFVLCLLLTPSAWASEVSENSVAIDVVDVANAVDTVETKPFPNIVVILADDLGWNDLGYQGSEIRTPRLDALAAAGVRLDRFYAQPMCSPTRASMLTGNSAARLGITRALSKLVETGLPLDQQILPQYLKDMGYQTSLVGKWHLGFRQREYLPTSRGFDSFYGHLTGGIGYWDHVHGGGYDWARNDEVLREEGYATHLMANEAVRVIKGRNPDEPLFLYAAFSAPHLPNEAPEETIASYADIENPHRRVHAAMVTELDTGIGKIVDALEEQGMLDNTLIWFMSDNGGLNPSAAPPAALSFVSTLDGWFGDTEIPWRFLEFVRVNSLQGGSDNQPLRSGKGTVYEGGVRVPSFLYWRGELEPQTVGEMITVQDVLPSILTMLQSDARNREFDGINRWQVLQDGQPGEVRDYVAVTLGGEALIQYPWKLIQFGPDEVELYNVEADPSEQNNLAEVTEHGTRRDEMIAALAAKPRGEQVGVPIWQVMWDMDFFGGDEDRPPWMEIAQESP
jgi:arylsulfatase A-like enzyme